MKTLLAFLTLIAFLSGCKSDPVEEDPKTAPLKVRYVKGEWLAAQGGSGGTNNFDTFKNFQYNFEVGENNRSVEINLSSGEIDVQFALFDPLGQRLNVSSIGRTPSGKYTLNAGKYRLVVCAARRAVGKFEFIIQGVLKDPEKIVSQTLQSGSQNWGMLGGGGLAKTFKNHFYTVEITDDNSSADIELESADTEVALYIYDELGQRIVNEYGNRYEFRIMAVKKGTYTVMVGTNSRGSVGSYRLNVHGKVQNLKKVESQVNTVKGNWANNAAADTYSLEITSANNSTLDMDLSSADVNVSVELQTGAGTYIFRKVSNKNEFIVSNELPKGTYRIVVKPYGSTGSGAYTLNVHGQFTNFKKL